MRLVRNLGGAAILALAAVPAFGQGIATPGGSGNGDVYAQLASANSVPIINIVPQSQAPAPPNFGASPANYLASDGSGVVAAMDPKTALGETGSCTPACDCCCADMFDHRTNVFAEYLYLRPFGADVSQGIQQNGVGGLGTAPAGDVGVATPEFASGYRVGFELACCDCNGIRATYTQYATHTTDALSAAPGIGGTAASLLLHPGTVTAASTFSELDADYGIDFRLADIDYTVLLTDCDNRAVNFNIGVRYAHLRQDFEQVGIFAGGGGDEDTTTGIHFDGVGLRTGFDGAWQLGDSRISAYGQGFINVLFGEFDSRYQQFNATTTTVEAASNWSDDRVLPILDYEIGLRWTSCNGHWQIGTGYYTAFWFNSVATPDFVHAVQTNDFNHVDRTITFTGFTTRIEYRF